MSVNIRRPRSCLSCLGWLVAILIIFVLLHNVYAQVRIYMVYQQALELAQQMGYTPDGFLRKGGYAANVNIVSGSVACSAVLYYATTLELSEFETRLLAAQPGTRRINFASDRSGEIYSQLPLSRNGVNGRQQGPQEHLPDILTIGWYLPKDGIVELYQTKRVTSVLTFDKRQIDGNIVLVRRHAGRYPFWVWC